MKLKNTKIKMNFDRKVTEKESVARTKLKNIIPITNDSMFKTLFSRKENIKFPAKLLSYIIDMDYENILKRIRFSKNETGKENQKDIAYRNDLVLEIDDTTINVELNNNGNEDIRNRNFSYLMRIREDVKYKQVIQININNYCYYDDLEVRTDYAILNYRGELYTDKIFIIDIYLPNIVKKSKDKKNILTEMERFLLIGIEENRKKALEYVGDDIVMMEFEEEVEKRSKDDELIEAYDKEWAIKELALREGKEIGIEQGKEIGIEQLNYLNQKIKEGMTIEEISNLINISINELKKSK